MNEKFELNESTIIPILNELRKPNGDKPRSGKINPNKKLKTFADVVFTNWEKLEIEAIPNPKLLELMIIKSIETVYGDWEQEKEANVSRMKAKIRDATLLSFGLLDKCPHTQNGIDVWLKDRYENYLDNPDFDFIFLDYYGEGTYQEIKKHTKKGKQPRPLNKLTSFSGTGRDAIASELLKIIQNKTYKQYLDENGDVPEFELPEPSFTRANFPIVIEREDELTQESSEEDDGSKKMGKDKIEGENGKGGESVSPKPPPDPPNPYLPIIKGLLAIVAFLTVALVAVVVFVVVDQMNSKQETSIAINDTKEVLPNTIAIKNKNITLPPGGDAYLDVEVKPSNITSEQLTYRSTNKEIVYPESLNSPHIIAKGLDKNEIYEASVIVSGDGNAQDTAYITVKGADADGSSGRGANTDDSQDGIER